jgi:hypothetical protein
MKKGFVSGALIGTILLWALSCGHLSNPALPKAELTADRDQASSCEDVTAEIMGLQAQQINVQKQIDTQRTQNILSGVGGHLLRVPGEYRDAEGRLGPVLRAFAKAAGLERPPDEGPGAEGRPLVGPGPGSAMGGPVEMTESAV